MHSTCVKVFSVIYTVAAEFSEGMVDDGYKDVVNIDISSVVIEAMQKKYSNRPQLKCIFYGRFQIYLLFLSTM